MSDIASRLRSHGLEVAFAVFTVLGLFLMVVMPIGETIPYHLIFIALTLVYGFAIWPPTRTLIWLVFVTVTTGAVMVNLAITGQIDWQECSEILLMPGIFLGQRWHQRRQLEAQRLMEMHSTRQQSLLDREQRFMQDAAHAIRTPITIARGHVELIAAGTRDLRILADLDVVLHELDRMSRLAADLLALEEIERPEALDLAEFDLTDLARETVARWAKSIERQIQVRSQGSALVVADRRRLGGVLDALIENSVKYTEPGDRIIVFAECGPVTARLGVEDSGPGVAPDSRPRVFDRFWRDLRAGVQPGSGLGLALVRVVSEVHGGSCGVTDSSLGGACIYIELPSAVTNEPQLAPVRHITV